MGRPEVTLIAALSLDGKLTKHDEAGSDFASAADRRFFDDAVRSFPCRIFGRSTYDVIRDRGFSELAPGHRRIVLTRNPERYRDDRDIEFSDEDVPKLLNRLHKEGIERIALLGGAETHRRFLEVDAVDRLWITFEPLLFGTGLPLTTGRLDLRFVHEDTLEIGDSAVVLKYRRPASDA